MYTLVNFDLLINALLPRGSFNASLFQEHKKINDSSQLIITLFNNSGSLSMLFARSAQRYRTVPTPSVDSYKTVPDQLLI